jgi:quinohemoprotein amine dehydrogenase
MEKARSLVPAMAPGNLQLGDSVCTLNTSQRSDSKMKRQVLLSFMAFMFSIPAAQAQKLGEPPAEEGIPVTDPLVIAKCGPCHARDERGNMERLSRERTTPEGWQEALKKMILQEHVTLTGSEARSIVRYLSAGHGLTPEEAKPVMYYAERRIQEETGTAYGPLVGACTKCHAAARALSWRRSAQDWKQLAQAHTAQYKMKTSEAAVAFLDRTAPLRTPQWAAWSKRSAASNLAGRWLVTAHVPGRGRYVGEMEIAAGSAPDEFNTRVTLRSIQDGSVLVRNGQCIVYGGYAWRGRSRGVNAPSSDPADLSSEAREALWIAPDEKKAEGRWFWGQYQEFGFDVRLEREASTPALLAMDHASLKAGSHGSRVRLFGDNFPARVTTSDLTLGPDVAVRRVVSQSRSEVVVEIDVAAEAKLGRRDVTLCGSVLEGAVAIYDRIDYVRVVPESSLAAFGNQKYAKGFQQFEAIGYQRGPDGKPHTADDLELGPVDGAWSMEVFYAVDTSHNSTVGNVSPAGLFTPAAESPGVNYDIWVIATALNNKDPKGEPLVGKGYVVVTIPEYTFNGRHYVRDLDRWIEEGTW